MSLGSNISDQLRHTSDTLDAKQLASAAKEQGAVAAHAAVDVGRDVAHKVGEQAAAVAEQAKEQLTSIVSHAKDELSTQVEHRGKQAARSARSLLHGAEHQVRKHVPGRKRSGPQAVAANVMTFVRRRPVWSLLIAAAVGFAAVRLARAVVAPAKGASNRGPVDAGSGSTSRTDRDSSGNGSAKFADSTGPLTPEAAGNGATAQYADAAGEKPGWSDAPPFDASGADVPARAASDDIADEASDVS
jgi:ElaB/YqjD/DUF883 family membrane-anchored ribosome-binding protein